MSADTNIEWCDSTFNPWIGCTKVSPGCNHCYAEVSTASRTLQVNWGAGQPRKRTSEANWREPMKWNNRPFHECGSCGWRGDAFGKDWIDEKTCPHCEQPDLHAARRRVFCASLADVFDNEVDPQWRLDLFDLIAATPNLDWLLVTKRISNVMPMLRGVAAAGSREDELSKLDVDKFGHCLAYDWVNHLRAPKNVWLGISVVNQEEADRDIPKLALTNAAVKFISMEPLLGPVDLHKHLGLTPNWVKTDTLRYSPNRRSDVDWVIVGGESGKDARPLLPEWVRVIKDRCESARVPFLFKQWGEFSLHEIGEDGRLNPSMPMNLKGLRVWSADSGFVEPSDDTPISHLFAPGAVVALPGGKKVTGKQLDGAEHMNYPRSRA